MITKYGRRKLDSKAYAEQSAAAAKVASGSEGGTVYGSRKAGANPEPTSPDNSFRARADADGNGIVTLAELEAKLREKPELLDEAISAEFADGKPRKGALVLFRELEQAKGEAARPEVIATIEQAQQQA